MALERSLLRMRTAAELAVETAEAAQAAKKAEASSVFVHAAGLSPSAELIAAAVDTGINVHVQVRPRHGDFIYTEEELATIREEIIAACTAGAYGVVIGATDATGTAPNVELLRELTQLAADNGAKSVTLDRVFDNFTDQPRALLLLSSAGLTRVYTSAGKESAVDAQAELQALVAIGDTMGVDIYAAGDIEVKNVHELRDVRLHGVLVDYTTPEDAKALVDTIKPWTR
ncbi:MAG: copper homeostasis protein CutC [Corynebacterium sp.]|nr:copper homeostasis protein CutC [Corynebacterium sp.]